MTVSSLDTILPRVSAVASYILMNIHNGVLQKTISLFDNKVYFEFSRDEQRSSGQRNGRKRIERQWKW